MSFTAMAISCEIPRSRKAQRALLFTLSQGQCEYCGTHLDRHTFHVDHVVPLRYRGLDAFENKRASCPSCNTAKGDRPLDYFRMYCAFKESKWADSITLPQYLGLVDDGLVKYDLSDFVFHFEKGANHD